MLSIYCLLFFTCCVIKAAVAKDCHDNIHNFNYKETELLLKAKAEMMKTYKNLCQENQSCTYDMTPETRTFFEKFDFDSPMHEHKSLLKSNVFADFSLFESDGSYIDFENCCYMVRGKFSTVSVKTSLKGNALGSFNTNVNVDIRDIPLCLINTCNDKNLEQEALSAAKRALIDLATPQRSKIEPQLNIIKNMDIPTACNFFGFDTCTFELTLKKDFYSASDKRVEKRGEEEVKEPTSKGIHIGRVKSIHELKSTALSSSATIKASSTLILYALINFFVII